MILYTSLLLFVVMENVLEILAVMFIVQVYKKIKRVDVAYEMYELIIKTSAFSIQ